MSERYNERNRIIRDYGGELIYLTLKFKQEIKGKNYNLYTVCKVIKKEDGEKKYIPLYNETFTEKQIERFYKNSSRYIPDEFEEDV